MMENNIQLYISKLLVENKYRLDTSKDNTAVMVVDIPKVSEILADKMIEFAKMHVKAALKAALDNGKIMFTDAFTSNPPSECTDDDYFISKESITSAYDIKNIK